MPARLFQLAALLLALGCWLALSDAGQAAPWRLDAGLLPADAVEHLRERYPEVRNPAELEALPDATSTPELQIKTAEGENVRLVERLRALAGDAAGAQRHFPGVQEIITIDGIRVEFPDGFSLARPSNTTPVVVLRFEADDAVALARIQATFRAAIISVAPDVRLPF